MHIRAKTTSTLSGTLAPPSSKSQNIRAILFATLAAGRSTLVNPLTSDDTSDALRIAKALGADIQVDTDRITLTSAGIPFQTSEQHLYSGNSGLTTLFSLPLLGLRAGDTRTPITFDCGDQMRARPIAPLVDALNQLGMDIRYLHTQAQCPLLLSGRLGGGKTEVDGLNSQYLSSLLISLPCAPVNSEIIVSNLHERPYVDMTLRWLDKQHIHYTHQRDPHADIFYIPGNQRYTAFHTNIPGDFSSASCIIAAAALIPGKVILTGLDMDEPQADKVLIPLLQEMGADLTMDDSNLVIQGGKPLRGIEIDANDCPDLVPALAIIATQARGKTHIYNVGQARIKETDRIHSMTAGLTQMGAKITTTDDSMTIWQSTLAGQHIKGFGDHRTVMSLSVAGLVAEGETVIDDAEAVAKTFPDFVAVMRTLGANIA